MRFKLFALFTIFFVSVQGYAADSMSFIIEQGILDYSQMNSTTKMSGADDINETETLMTTMPNSLQICGVMGPLRLYFYPTKANVAFGAGYMLRKNIELGGKLAMNSDRLSKAGSEDSTNIYGVYAIWTVPVGHDAVELTVPFTLSSGTAKSPGAGTNSTLSGMNFQPGGNYVHPIVKNFAWMGGLSYKIDSQSNSVAGGTKQTVNSNGFDLNLTTFRFTF